MGEGRELLPRDGLGEALATGDRGRDAAGGKAGRQGGEERRRRRSDHDDITSPRLDHALDLIGIHAIPGVGARDLQEGRAWRIWSSRGDNRSGYRRAGCARRSKRPLDLRPRSGAPRIEQPNHLARTGTGCEEPQGVAG